MIYRLDKDPVVSLHTGDRVKITVLQGFANVEVME